MSRLKLGVIGGLGPAATACFYSMVTDMTNARTDQEHLEIIIYSNPAIPDRSDYITGKSPDSPLPLLIQAGRALARLDVANIAIPCVTAHHFYDELSKAASAPVINMLTETLAYLRDLGVKRVGLMATDGTNASGVFHRLLTTGGIDVLMPTATEQAGIMDVIYNYKANLRVDYSGTIAAAARMKNAGAEVVLLSCTELSLLKRDAGLDESYVDMLEILARRAIELSGGESRIKGAGYDN